MVPGVALHLKKGHRRRGTGAKTSAGSSNTSSTSGPPRATEGPNKDGGQRGFGVELVVRRAAWSALQVSPAGQPGTHPDSLAVRN